MTTTPVPIGADPFFASARPAASERRRDDGDQRCQDDAA